jgi:pantoate--beta-alanine ligase
MDLVHTIADLRKRLAGEPFVALVPTMGNLHAGHVSLVDLARKTGDGPHVPRGGTSGPSPVVVASIFVNRLQFEPGGDFDRYPRTLKEDCAKLEKAGAHVVFAPDEREMYPAAQEIAVTPPKVAEALEGEHRPGHFQGVATIVSKLFNIVAPQAAVFGKKDYQQLAVIRALVRQLNFGIEIVAAETVREPDGLAMSSRNGYLSAAERKEAIRLNRNLRGVKEALETGAEDLRSLEDAAMEDLRKAGWRVDYVAVRDRVELAPPRPGQRELVVLGAAWLGKTRLIDNLEIER